MAVGSATVQVIYGASSAAGLPLLGIIWRHRQQTGARPLLASVAGAWWWSTGLFLATLAADVGVSTLLVRSIYLGVGLTVAGSFLFALAYTGRDHRVTGRVIALLALEPMAALALAFANPGAVFFTAITPDPTSATGVAIEFGPAFALHTLYSYVLVLAVGALFLDLAYRTRRPYRVQLLVVLGAVAIPLVSNVLTVADVADFDTTPVGFLLSAALFTVAITRFRLIDLAPIARDRVVESVTDAVFVVDTDHRLVDVNPAGEDLAREFVGDVRVLGEDVRDLLAFVPDVGELYADIVAAGTADTVEYSLGGGYFQAEAAPIDDPRGRTVGWLFLIRDVTERKRRERQLRDRNAQLDEFASVVSHDLRNPLQVARGRVELARETGDTAHLDAVVEAHDRMESIIDDVLSLARSGDRATDLEPVDLGAVAESAWDGVETGDGVLRTTTDARITADRDRLLRLLENLFRNAVEHASTGQADDTSGKPTDTGDVPDTPRTDPTVDPRVTVDVGLLRADGEPDGFYVADDGPGIPPAERDTVFESGYSTSPEGTGFGLTIVSQIAAAHGWTVTATESETGGARFEVSGVGIVGT